ncbi:hypothetical protein HYH03_011170 [Edaphochlamys debaryana]|uniref:Uncharacterized protein n=1 Tax=Edaphochlamys debaryana TaxID=47281 RepID=A0A835XUA1_9CHLO|nr:hypothetical protein HYH03_011170 [Edaphochlamys debaryana]|eukprot:KAG2490368.1 hypothetical protein HYH03_011170 [Edaphochlamys debaryana]
MELPAGPRTGPAAPSRVGSDRTSQLSSFAEAAQRLSAEPSNGASRCRFAPDVDAQAGTSGHHSAAESRDGGPRGLFEPRRAHFMASGSGHFPDASNNNSYLGPEPRAQTEPNADLDDDRSTPDRCTPDRLTPDRPSLPSVRTVRISHRLRSPRTSNRALLTRQRTPYGMRRFITATPPGTCSGAAPAAASTDGGRFVFGVSLTGESSVDGGLPVAGSSPSLQPPARPYSAANPPAAGANRAVRATSVPAASDVGRGLGAGPGGRRPRFGGAVVIGEPVPEEPNLLSPRTTDPGLLERRATPCPLKWGRWAEGSWDGASASEGGFARGITDGGEGGTETSAGLFSTEAGYDAPASLDYARRRWNRSSSLHRSRGRSGAGAAPFAAGASGAGGPSVGGYVHPHPHRALRVQVSLTKAFRRTSISSLLGAGAAGVEGSDVDSPASGPSAAGLLGAALGVSGSANTPTRHGRRRNLAGNEDLGLEAFLARFQPPPMPPMGAGAGTAFPGQGPAPMHGGAAASAAAPSPGPGSGTGAAIGVRNCSFGGGSVGGGSFGRGSGTYPSGLPPTPPRPPRSPMPPAIQAGYPPFCHPADMPPPAAFRGVPASPHAGAVTSPDGPPSASLRYGMLGSLPPTPTPAAGAASAAVTPDLFTAPHAHATPATTGASPASALPLGSAPQDPAAAAATTNNQDSAPEIGPNQMGVTRPPPPPAARRLAMQIVATEHIPSTLPAVGSHAPQIVSHMQPSFQQLSAPQRRVPHMSPPPPLALPPSGGTGVSHLTSPTSPGVGSAQASYGRTVYGDMAEAVHVSQYSRAYGANPAYGVAEALSIVSSMTSYHDGITTPPTQASPQASPGAARPAGPPRPWLQPPRAGAWGSRATQSSDGGVGAFPASAAAAAAAAARAGGAVPGVRTPAASMHAATAAGSPHLRRSNMGNSPLASAGAGAGNVFAPGLPRPCSACNMAGAGDGTERRATTNGGGGIDQISTMTNGRPSADGSNVSIGRNRRALRHVGSQRSHAPDEDDSAESLAKLEYGTSDYGGCASEYDAYGNPAATTKGDNAGLASATGGGGDEEGMLQSEGLIVLGGPREEHTYRRLQDDAAAAGVGWAAEDLSMSVSAKLAAVSAAVAAAAAAAAATAQQQPLASPPLRHVLVTELMKGASAGGAAVGGAASPSRLSRCTSAARQQAEEAAAEAVAEAAAAHWL